MPDATQCAAGLDKLDIETFFSETMKKIHACESASDYNGIKIEFLWCAVCMSITIRVAVRAVGLEITLLSLGLHRPLHGCDCNESSA